MTYTQLVLCVKAIMLKAAHSCHSYNFFSLQLPVWTIASNFGLILVLLIVIIT